MGALDFTNLDETDFEEFCFELLGELGFVNVDWRKGTPKPASPADRGRDIEAQLERKDFDGSTYLETWFVDAKHYARGVPPEAFQGLLAWAQAERPDVALIVASGFLSNPAKDNLKLYVQNQRPPFRIRWWERPVLARLTRDKRAFLDRFVLSGTRSQSEILAAESEFYDRVWHERHLVMLAKVEAGEDDVTPEILKMAKEAAEGVRERHPSGDIRPVNDDFEWGMWNGKLSALRWVLGDDWDFLDT